MQTIPEISEVPEEILNHHFVVSLLDRVDFLTKRVEQLESEIRLLKTHSPKPVIPPSSNLETTKHQPKDGIKKNSFH